MNHRKRHHLRSFTLIELIFVILIIAGICLGAIYLINHQRNKVTPLPNVVTDSEDAVIDRFEERLTYMWETLREEHAGKGPESWHSDGQQLAYRFMKDTNYSYDVSKMDSLLFPVKATVSLHTEVLIHFEKRKTQDDSLGEPGTEPRITIHPEARLRFKGFIEVFFRYNNRSRNWELNEVFVGDGTRSEKGLLERTEITIDGKPVDVFNDDSILNSIIKGRLHSHLQRKWLDSLPDPD